MSGTINLSAPRLMDIVCGNTRARQRRRVILNNDRVSPFAPLLPTRRRRRVCVNKNILLRLVAFQCGKLHGLCELYNSLAWLFNLRCMFSTTFGHIDCLPHECHILKEKARERTFQSAWTSVMPLSMASSIQPASRHTIVCTCTSIPQESSCVRCAPEFQMSVPSFPRTHTHPIQDFRSENSCPSLRCCCCRRWATHFSHLSISQFGVGVDL